MSAEPTAGSTETLLLARGVQKSFGGLRALVDCTLEVKRHSITGLVGPNGSGKTTLFNVITGYQRPDEGRIVLDELEITGFTPEKVFAAGIGRTFQLTRVFPRISVLENMLVASQRSGAWIRSVLSLDSRPDERSRAKELLEFVGLAALAEHPAGSLSYGQKKLLELAYVLVADPQVLLLDEPAGGINPTLLNQLRERIQDLRNMGKTFLVIEHNLRFVTELCDFVWVMDQGSVIVGGPPRTIQTDQRVLDAYLGTMEEDDDDDAMG
ncbi:MAG: ABC transporter ATP-binding protein [Actinomycetota bacterium]|jgi:ABC-type branched-subunit amino acid transport system ATPase component|nr:ABC transporter ATP-binding protein [Actinomycetota bacterium]